MRALDVQNRPLRLETPLGPDTFGVTRFRATEAISTLFSCQLDVVADVAADISFEKLIGQPATVQLQTTANGARFFHGIIHELTEGAMDDWFIHFSLELVPAFGLLRHRVRSRIFQQQSVPDILKLVLDGLDVSFNLSKSYLPRNYCVQYDESDHAFASRLMEEEGIHYYFRHRSGGHTLVISDDPLIHPDLPDNAAFRFDPLEKAAGEQPRITQWSKTQTVTPGKWTVWDHHFELPEQHLEGTAHPAETVAAGEGQHRLAGGYNRQLEIFDGSAGHAPRFDGIRPDGGERPEEMRRAFDEAKRVARLRMEEGTAQALTTRGRGNAAAFNPGHAFELTHHRRASGKYLLTEVQHEAEQAGFRSGDEPTFRYANVFQAAPVAVAYRPRRVHPRPVISGPQTATVVGPPGQDTFLDRFGRVKVQFPWDRDGKVDASSSCWVRVAQIWAGNHWGAFFWPRIGHEVVVAFEEGDVDRPLITGSVYNAKNLPPFNLPDNALIAGIKSCSAGPNANPQETFNGILFHDQPGHEHLEVHSERDERWSSEANRTMRVGQDLTTVVGGLPITIGSGSGGGGNVFERAWNTSWGAITSHLARNVNFTIGTAGHFTLGSFGNYVIGQKFQIATHPGAFIKGFGGDALTAAVAGFALGSMGFVDMIIGGGMFPKYGPQVEVSRGSQLQTTGKGSALALALVSVVDGIAIAGNIAAAASPDAVNPIFALGKTVESSAMGVLCGVESTLAWLEAAEALAKQGIERTELLARHAELLGVSAALKEVYIGKSAEHIAQFIEMRVGDAKNALRSGDPGFAVQECDTYLLSARKRAYLTAHNPQGESKVAMAADAIDIDTKNFYAFANGHAYLWGVEDVTLNGHEINLEARHDLVPATLKMLDTGITLDVPTGGHIELTQTALTLKVGTSVLTIGPDEIALQVGKNRLALGPSGFTLNALMIATKAELSIVSRAAVKKTEVQGLMEILAAIKKD